MMKVAPRPTAVSHLAPRIGLLQRKCACGGTPGPTGECEACRKKRLQRQSSKVGAGTQHDSAVLPIVHEVLRSPSQPLHADTRAFMGPRFGHDFARLCVHVNGAMDEESEEETPGAGLPLMPALGAPSEEDLTRGPQRLGQPAQGPKCPTKTVVDKLIDTTPEGIKKGYPTGYGATAVMRVEPDSTNWDGTQIVELLKQTKNTCPEEFGISPCSGHSTFPVGGEANSSILGKLPATRNRFYDHHFTRWNKGSLLHDRNPKGIDSCEAVCDQNYSCGGNVIGTHAITRTFTKGKSGSRDVTLVAVTKK